MVKWGAFDTRGWVWCLVKSLVGMWRKCWVVWVTSDCWIGVLLREPVGSVSLDAWFGGGVLQPGVGGVEDDALLGCGDFPPSSIEVVEG